jgi:hypothetical protein
MKQIVKLIILFICCYGGVISCRSDRKSRTSEEFSNETSEVIEKIEDIKKVYNICPSPAEMLSLIEVENMQFRNDILNPTRNAEKYLDVRSLTVNLGVYATDLAYSALFGRREETIDYLEQVQDIAEKIRISGTVNDRLIERARSNVNYIDSLFNISNEAFINMIFFCEKNDRPSTITLISTGAFIESLYLSIAMVDAYNTRESMMQHLADQGYILDNLMTNSENEAADPNVAYALQILKPLKALYDQFGDTGGTTTIRKESSGKLVIGGKTKKMLSEQDFNKLKDEIASIRDNVINKNNL